MYTVLFFHTVHGVPQDWKRSVFIPVSKKGNAKECSNYLTIALISHASKVMFKILQARLQQYMNFQMFKLDLEKTEGTRDQIANILWIIEKARDFQKIDYAKDLTVWNTTNGGKPLKRWEYKTTLPAS